MTSLDSTLTTSHSVSLSGLAPSTGFHYRVRSKDGQNNLTISGDQTFSTTATPDTTPPFVSLTAPSNGATVSGSSVTLSASASDDVGVAGVTFKVNGVIIGSEDISSQYSVTWDSTAVADGTHTLVAVARDSSGNYATSSPITVTVNNLVALSAGSADLYWVGASGNWSDAHHWAITSGGVGQYNPPTTCNVVHFDSNSGAGTVSIDILANAASISLAQSGLRKCIDALEHFTPDLLLCGLREHCRFAHRQFKCCTF